MAKPLPVVRLLAAGGLLALSLASCGDPCPFGLLARRQFPGVVPCCGASIRQDFQSPDDVEIDVASVALGGGRVDVWVTRSDCDQLFDGPYPPPSGTAPRCPVILGPIPNGSTSARTRVSSGSYRLHFHGYSSNTGASQAGAEVGFWGSNCTGTTF